MRDRSQRIDWVDRYLRERLSAEDEAAFEEALLESPELQTELEAALALRAILAQGSEGAPGQAAAEPPARPFERPAGWQPVALAATVVLAVLSTVMWWKTGNESADLQRQLKALAQPRDEVLTVPVPIMRSAGGRTPDVIVQKPQGRAAVLLDIELGLAAREYATLDFALVDPNGKSLLAWQSAPTADGRATAVIATEQIPASRVWLHISDADGNTLERRLLEFLEP